MRETFGISLMKKDTQGSTNLRDTMDSVIPFWEAPGKGGNQCSAGLA